MNSDRWQQIETLVQAALAVPVAERSAWLVAQCEGEASLREEVTSLLAVADKSEGFLRQPAGAQAARILLESEEGLGRTGQSIGQYKVVREIGRGGMGVVLLAVRDDDQFKKHVAIKVLRRGMDTEDILRRFRNERQILASLEHPHIARLIDGGMTEEGLPYFVLEYVEGQPLDQYCDGRRLATSERLHIFSKVCAAVQYAHQNLIVHRDLKPSNILVTAEGEPKLLDFGIAKLLNPELTTYTISPTATMARLMTPDYASPEQIRGRTITTASDVYSLGVVLYRLLTGHAPYHFVDSSPQEIERLVCDTEPERPSTAVSRVEEITTAKGLTSITPESVALARDEQPDTLRRTLRGDLDNIVLMAMRKDAERRYGSAAQLFDDIRRYLDGLPVTARPNTFGYRASKFVARNRVAAAAAAMIGIALVGGIIATAWQARVARLERDRARLEQAKTQRINTFLQDILKASDPSRQLPNSQKSRELTIKDGLDYAAARVGSEMTDQPDARAELQSIIGNSYLTLGHYDLAEPHLRASLATQIDLHGEDHPVVTKTLVVLAQLQISKGNYVAVEPIYRQLITIYRRSRAKGNADAEEFAVVLNDFSLILRQQARFAEAESVLREALALAPGIPVEMPGVVGLVRTNLALVLADQGDFAGAEALYRAGIDESRRMPGRERIELAVALTGLGDLLVEQGRYAEAQSVLEEGEGIYRRVLGNAHPYLGTNLGIQGDLLYFKGDYVGAQQKINGCLEILRSSVSDTHPRYASSLTVLGLILNKTGRSAQAEAALRDALRIRTRILPAGHYLIARTESAMGECLTSQKRYAEAEALLTKSHDALSKTQGAQNPRTLLARRRLVELYHKWNKPELASKYR